MIRRVLLIGGLFAAGCRSSEPAPAATSFVGPQGSPIVVESLPAKRIVSIMAAATEWLVLLDAESTLVARTDFDRQDELAHLPSIGGGLETSPEVIAALEPDVVLGWRNRSSVDLSVALGPLGIPVIAVEATDTAEAFEQLRTLAVLVGREARGIVVADSIRERLASLATAGCPSGHPIETVAIEIWADPPMTAGGGTWMSELLSAACLRNAFDDLNAAWPTISLEALVDRQPHWVLTSRDDSKGDRLTALREQAGWRELTAVARGRVLEIDGDIFSRAGPRMAEWVQAVQEALAVHRSESQAPE